MAFFKVTDVRVGRRADSTVTAFIDGLGQGSALSIPVDPLRAGPMLAVFILGRDCYWDDTHVFSTMVGDWDQGPSTIDKGRVASWDVRIPETAGVKPVFFLTLLSDSEVRPTSGNAATGWAQIEVMQKDVPLILALLRSRYCYYSSAGLRNTDIREDIGWTGLP
jgi:hypothetical protein